MERTRTFEWQDPKIGGDAARTMAGIDFLRTHGMNGAAPVAACLGFALVEAEPGRVVFEMTPGEFHHNPIGTVHGGVVATLCDSAAGAAVHSMLRKGQGYTTLEIKVNFVRPLGTTTGPVRCEGTVLSFGSRIATSQARLVDGAGKLLAHATSTCLVLS